jgi:hypothetical protein
VKKKMAETKSDAVTDIDDLLTAYNEVQKELTEARRCWREEFDKRKALQKQFDSLGQGTGFLDVEKLSEDLYTAEKCEYTRQEKITALNDELYRAKAEGKYKIDNLVLGYLNDKEGMKEAGYTRKPDYEKYLRNELLTEDIKEIEDGYKKLTEKIEQLKQDSKAAAIDMKKLKRDYQNRLVFAEINNRPTVPCECEENDKPAFKSPEETIKVI